MNELINLYNNSIIYFPDIFFTLFLTSAIIAIFFLIHVSIFTKKQIIIFSKKIKKNFRQINFNKKPRTKLEILIMRTKNFQIIIKVVFLNLEARSNKIIKRIEKEILIDEK